MKKVFLLSCLLLSALLTFAQETKKVAILEVVDRENKLTYSQKLVLRSNMARAIANTDGYEAYDRSDVDVIMSEQDFQRTGMVSDAEIRKLGELTGVSLILVTEGVLTGDDKIFVSAKILNIETGRVDMMDNLSMGLNTEAIQEGCTTLAKRLFGVTVTNSAIEKYTIKRLSSKEYLYMDKYMNKESYETFLHANCSQAYQKFLKGKRMIKGGWACVGSGLALLAGGVLCMTIDLGYYDAGEPNPIKRMGGAFIGIGIVAAGGGIPLIIIGNINQKKSVDMYNNTCASSSVTPLTFNLTAGQNGLGIAMQF